MIATTLGILDPKSPVYGFQTQYILPASLFLLLVTVDLKAILKLGKAALIMMAAGSLGIVFGAPLVFFIFKRWIGADMWGGFGALSGSWTGGSANLIAVKEALGTPDAVFTPMVVVDTIVPYVWMGILVALAGSQKWFDGKIRAERKILDELNHKTLNLKKTTERLTFPTVFLVLIVGAIGMLFAVTTAQHLPVIKDVISTYAWTIILVTAAALSLSFTKLRTLETHGSKTIGYFLLYFVLTGIGAKADLSSLNSTVILIAAGFCIVIIHAAVLLLTARLIRAPMFLVAVASQANIGGVASAPIVAEIYQPGLSSVGLLLAILGNISGTYLGIFSGQLCRLFN